MSEESDRAGADQAMPNRGRRREQPIIDAQANAAPDPKPARMRGAGLALAASILALGGASASLWFTLNARETNATSEAAAALAQRLDRLERRVGALENKPAPNIPDTAPLAARIASIDTKADRIAAEATRAAQLAEDALRKTAAPVAAAPHETPADLGPLEKRIDALEQRPMPQMDDARLSKIESDLSAVRKNADSTDRNRGPAMAAVAASLQQKLDRGESFMREIAALEKLGADAKILVILKPLATHGATAPQKLAQDFSSRTSALLRAAQPASENEDLLDRLGRSATSLVRIRPIGESTQENAPALIARIETALQRYDVTSAVALFEKLPAGVQDQARDWAQLAKGRAQADAAARMLMTQAVDMIAEK